MSKEDKQFVVSGLQTLAGLESVLNALIANSPLSVEHKVIIKDTFLITSSCTAKVFDVGASWSKTSKEVIKHVSNKTPGLVVVYRERADPRDCGTTC